MTGGHALSSLLLPCDLKPSMFCYRRCKLQRNLIEQQALASYGPCQTGTAFFHLLKPLSTRWQATLLQVILARQRLDLRYPVVQQAAWLCQSCLSAYCYYSNSIGCQSAEYSVHYSDMNRSLAECYAQLFVKHNIRSTAYISCLTPPTVPCCCALCCNRTS